MQAPPKALYTGESHARRCKARKARQQNARQKEAETTSEKQEGGERDGYRSMHKVLCLRYAIYTTGQRPTIVDAISKAGRIALRHTGVNPLYAGMAMRAIASARDVPELLGIARDSPGLSERYAPCACGLADQSVRAPIKMMCGTTPTPKAGLDLMLAPVCTGLRPLEGHASSIGDTCVSNCGEAAPKAAEEPPMSAYLGPRSGSPVPVHALVGGSSRARQTAEQEDRDAWYRYCIQGFL